LCEIGNHGSNQRRAINGNKRGNWRIGIGALDIIVQEGEGDNILC